jgi:hypothetical protein
LDSSPAHTRTITERSVFYQLASETRVVRLDLDAGESAGEVGGYGALVGIRHDNGETTRSTGRQWDKPGHDVERLRENQNRSSSA